VHLRGWPLPLRWGVTAVAVIVSAAVRYAIFGSTDDLPFVLFFPAVIGAAIFFNHGSGVFATALSAVLAVSLFMGDDPLSSTKNVVRLVLFCGVGGLIAIAAETLHEAYAEAERDRARANDPRRDGRPQTPANRRGISTAPGALRPHARGLRRQRRALDDRRARSLVSI